MDPETLGNEDLVRRLPLPLAQLYRRAHNAVSAASRLNTAYCLWEASLKLMGSVAVATYAGRGDHSPELADRLKNLVRPALGHWWEFLRILVPVLAEAGDPGFRRMGELLFGRARDDMPRAAGLDAALLDVLDGRAGARSTVRLVELFDHLIRFRNREIGHGPLGQQSAAFYERVGRALVAGVVELLGRLDVTAGRRLIYVADVRRDPGGDWLVERFEMIGEASRRLRPLEVPVAEAAGLPHPGRVYLEAEDDGRRPILQSLHPLVLCNHDTAEVFFLNARRGLKRAEYLCYHPGRVEERPDLCVDHRSLLARVLGMPVDVGQVDSWVARSAAEDPPAPAMPAAPSRRLGEFELVSELGRGGMGVVYRAWQPSLGRHVALKRLLNAGDAKAESRFTREIHALGRVDHSNLVKTYTSGSDGEYWFYAMELVEGATLAAICETLQSSCPGASRVDLDTWRSSVSGACEQARQAERPVGSADGGDFPRATEPRPAWTSPRPQAARSYARHVAELARQVAGAAHALHEAGVVHRDIKPGNIMVTADGQQAVLMDLGLAQLADDVHGKLTRTRQFVGTLRYASPEQVLAVGGVDRRSDVYSLGASLWELLTLRPMFGATEQTPTPELMQRIQYEEPELVRRYHPGVPRDLEAIVHKCLAKDPRRRYQAAAELADDLQRFLDGESVRARREHLALRLWRKARRRPAATTLGLLVIIAAAALAIAVPKAIQAQRIADIAAQLGDLIERGEPSEPDLGRFDRLIAELEPLDPQLATNRRRQLVDRIARRIDEEIRTETTVEPEDEARLRGEIRLLGARDAEKSSELERRLAQRVRSWQEVARLDPPFDHVERVFDPSRMAVDEGRLGPRALDKPTTGAGPVLSTFLPSRVACRGNVRLDVTLGAGSWDSAAGIGLLLYDNQWHTGPIRGLAYDQVGKTLIIVDERGESWLWDIQAHSPTRLLPPSVGSISLAFGLPGGKDARGSEPGTPELRDVALGKTIPEGRSVRIGQLVAAVAPAGRAVALAAPGGSVTLFAARDGSLHRVREYRLKGREILCLALADAGRMIAAGSRDGGISLLDPDSETPRAVLSEHIGEVNALAFHHNGVLLASGGADTKVHLWDVAKAGRTSLQGHEGKVTALAFSPDGRTLASGGRDGAVRLWDLGTEQSRTPLTRHTPAVSCLAFSPDGRTLAVSHGSEVTIWDTRTSRSLELLRSQHYALRLLAPRPIHSLGSRRAPSHPVALGDEIAANRPLRVQIARDGQVLREQDVTLTSRGQLTLTARLEGGTLELLVDGTQSVVFQDLFPLSGTARGSFGLELPATARIECMVASLHRPADKPSPMERGDESYAKGELRGALDAYREQQGDAAKPQVVQEARCKEGVCLAALGQTEDAIRVFKQVAAESGDRWPVIAGCRLWLLHLQRRELDQAYAVYTELSSQRRLEQIAGLVPTDIPAAIVNAYAPDSSYSQIVRNPKLVQDLRLALAIARDIRGPVDQQLTIKWLLALAYHEDGQFERAVASYAELLANQMLPRHDQAMVMEYYCWALGQLHKDEVARTELDRRIAAGGDATPFLFICRAQIRARQGQWAAAREDLDEYFRHRTDQDGGWFYQACLIRGFVREALGDADGARGSWREGYQAASGTDDMALLHVSILASLSEDLTVDDVRIMFNTVLGRLPTNVAPMKIAENLNFRFEDIVSGLKTVWRSPRGREYARKIAVLDISFSDCIQIQVPLVVAEICRYGAFGDTLSPDDDKLLWMMVQNLFRDYLERRLDQKHFIQLMTTWIGLPFTWPFAARAIRPETRGPLAYVLGSRYELIGRPGDARSLFQTALDDSGPGTLLRRRAQVALDRLKASK